MKKVLHRTVTRTSTVKMDQILDMSHVPPLATLRALAHTCHGLGGVVPSPQLSYRDLRSMPVRPRHALPTDVVPTTDHLGKSPRALMIDKA